MIQCTGVSKEERLGWRIVGGRASAELEELGLVLKLHLHGNGLRGSMCWVWGDIPANRDYRGASGTKVGEQGTVVGKAWAWSGHEASRGCFTQHSACPRELQREGRSPRGRPTAQAQLGLHRSSSLGRASCWSTRWHYGAPCCRHPPEDQPPWPLSGATGYQVLHLRPEEGGLCNKNFGFGGK